MSTKLPLHNAAAAFRNESITENAVGEGVGVASSSIDSKINLN